MPGNVGNAVSTTVLPGDLAMSFRRVYRHEVGVNAYIDGRATVEARTATPRRRWEIEYSLPPSRLAALRAFWVDNRHKAFLFYDRLERMEEGLTPLYDETGSASGAGTYEVRFAEDDWGQENEVQRGTVRLGLVEVT